jgi:hypothetical protein
MLKKNVLQQKKSVNDGQRCRCCPQQLKRVAYLFAETGRVKKLVRILPEGIHPLYPRRLRVPSTVVVRTEPMARFEPGPATSMGQNLGLFSESL